MQGVGLLMKLLFYSAQNQGVGKNLARQVRVEFPEIQVDQVDSIQGISEKVCRPLNGIRVIMVSVTNREELIRLQCLHHLMDNIRLILILPRDAQNVEKLALMLQPSFICFADTRFNDIKLVLAKLQRI